MQRINEVITAVRYSPAFLSSSTLAGRVVVEGVEGVVEVVAVVVEAVEAAGVVAFVVVGVIVGVIVVAFIIVVTVSVFAGTCVDVLPWSWYVLLDAELVIFDTSVVVSIIVVVVTQRPQIWGHLSLTSVSLQLFSCARCEQSGDWSIQAVVWLCTCRILQVHVYY